MQALIRSLWGSKGHHGQHMSVSVLTTPKDPMGISWRDLGRPGLENLRTTRLNALKAFKSKVSLGKPYGPTMKLV